MSAMRRSLLLCMYVAQEPAKPRELHRAGGCERGARADRARPAPARGERPKEGVGVVGVGVEEVAGVGQEREHDGAAVQKGGCGGGGLV